MDSERRSERYPSHRPLLIRCATWTEFVETYASDICRGGMFIRSDETPEVLSSVELKLLLPDGLEVAVTARVVHVVTSEQAEQFGRVAGMGVEFVHVDAEQKRQILQLVEFARTQGDGADPNANFNRALFESSQSISVRDVAARLSMMPGTPGEAPAAARPKSQVNMPAVQVNDNAERPDPSQVAVRARPASTQLDPRLFGRPATQPVGGATSRSSATNPIVRTPTQPLAGATGRSSATNPIVRTPTQPLAGATGRSSATNPIVRSPTGPLTSASSRSSMSQPIVRAPTGPLTAAGGRQQSSPIVRTPTGPLNPTSGHPSQAADRAASGPISGSPGSPSGNPQPGENPSGPPLSPSGQPLPPAKPTDVNRLKLVLNQLNHKHFEDAARMAREMLIDNPGDPQVLKVQHICFARMAIARNDPATAAEQYDKALRYEENNREAREFVKNYMRERKLNSLPFGRYFVKKK